MNEGYLTWHLCSSAEKHSTCREERRGIQIIFRKLLLQLSSVHLRKLALAARVSLIHSPISKAGNMLTFIQWFPSFSHQIKITPWTFTAQLLQSDLQRNSTLFNSRKAFIQYQTRYCQHSGIWKKWTPKWSEWIHTAAKVSVCSGIFMVSYSSLASLFFYPCCWVLLFLPVVFSYCFQVLLFKPCL